MWPSTLYLVLYAFFNGILVYSSIALYCILLLPLVCLEENLEKGLLAYQHTAGRRLARLARAGPAGPAGFSFTALLPNE